MLEEMCFLSTCSDGECDTRSETRQSEKKPSTLRLCDRVSLQNMMDFRLTRNFKKAAVTQPQSSAYGTTTTTKRTILVSWYLARAWQKKVIWRSLCVMASKYIKIAAGHSNSIISPETEIICSWFLALSLSFSACMCAMLYSVQFYHGSTLCGWNEWIVELECGRDGKKNPIHHKKTHAHKKRKMQKNAVLKEALSNGYDIRNSIESALGPTHSNISRRNVPHTCSNARRSCTPNDICSIKFWFTYL